MSNYAIKISQQGKDIHLADYNELRFTSEFPALKVGQSGYHQVLLARQIDPTLQMTPVLYAQVKIPHNVGKTPMFIAYTQHHTIAETSTKVESFKQFSWTDILSIDATYDYIEITNEYKAYTDDMYIYFTWTITSPTDLYERLDFFYFIFEEPQAQNEYNVVGDGFAGNSIVGQGIIAKPFNS